ncbi:MAG TPA: LuxR C-terminal-related transcriptional regulator [Alphaproteobacteria bacterium]|nr:LuxR C-terminal-related transcriptional regulator [Alphaproteobacteria bacterium]
MAERFLRQRPHLMIAESCHKYGKRRRPPARSEEGARLQQLMRAILAMTQPIGASETVPQSYCDAEHVLLDADIDGDRYLLIKMPQAERKSLPLSPRELEIVRMVAQGHQNKAIAVVLNISSWTVCTHLRRIFAKLSVSSRAAMVARLTEFGAMVERKISVEQTVVRSGTKSTAAPRDTGPAEPSTGPQTRLEPAQSRPHHAARSHPVAETGTGAVRRSPIGSDPTSVDRQGSKAPALAVTRSR